MANGHLRGRATVGEIHRRTGLDKATIVRMLESRVMLNSALTTKDAVQTLLPPLTQTAARMAMALAGRWGQ